MTDARVQTSPPNDAALGAARWTACVRCIRRAVGDRSGAAAVEFAIVSAMLIFAIVFVMLVGLILYINQALDFATTKAARQIMTGYVQKNGISQSDFRTTLLCPNLPAAINCNDVIVNVQTLTEAPQPSGYYLFVNSNQSGLLYPTLSNASAQYSPGVPTSFVYVQAVYPITIIPRFLATQLGTASYNGSSAYLATSTVAFRNEHY